MSENDLEVRKWEAGVREWEYKWFGCSQEAGRMPGTVKSADIISVAVHGEYSACQREICSKNLVFCAFFPVMGSCFLYVL